MKPFNLEEARAGKPVCTRDGRPVRVVSFEVNSSTGESVAALVPRTSNGDDMFLSYFASGRHYSNREGDVDLFMAPVQRTVWVNLYRDSDGSVLVTPRPCDTEAEANHQADAASNYIGAFPITYEE